MKEYFTAISPMLSGMLTDFKEICVEVVTGIKSLWQSSDADTAAKETAVEVGRGFFQSFNLSIISTLLDSADARNALSHSLQANFVLYMLPALFYEMGLKPGIRSICGESSYVETAVEIAATLYLIRQQIRCYNDNVYYNSLLAKAVTKELGEQDTVKTCGCEDSSLVQASLSSSLYYAGSLLAVHVLTSSIPYVGSYLRFPLRVYLDGQCLLEYKLASVGTCTEHRYQVIEKNNNFALGLGLGLHGISKASMGALKILTGIHSPFIEEAFLLTIYPQHIMASLLIDRPLRDKKMTRDIFHLNQFRRVSRFTTESMIHLTIEEIIPALTRHKPDYDWLTLFQRITSMPPMRIAMRLFLDHDFCSLTDYLNRPSVKLYFEKNKAIFIGTYDYLNNLREDKFAIIGMYLPNIIVSNKSKKILGIIKDPSANLTFRMADDFLNRVYPDRKKQEIRNIRFIEDAKKITELDDNQKREGLTVTTDFNKNNSPSLFSTITRRSSAHPEEQALAEKDKKSLKTMSVFL